MSITTRPVRKTWLDGRMQPCGGSILVELAFPMEEDPGLKVVMPTPVEIALNGGDMSWDAPVSDLYPNGVQYRITPKLSDSTGALIEPNGRPAAPYMVLIPYGTDEIELPPGVFPSQSVIGVVGPAGAGVVFLEAGEEVAPGTPMALIVRPAS